MSTDKQKQFFIVILLPAVLFSTFLIVFLSSQAGPEETGVEVCDLEDNDGDGEIDEGFIATCTEDADCGPTGFYGDPYCKDDAVWQGYYATSCAGEAGTCLSECSSEQTERFVQRCEEGCMRGACL